MGHFIPLNLTSVAIFSPARSNMNILTWRPVKARVEESLTVRVKGVSSRLKALFHTGRGVIRRLTAMWLTSNLGISHFGKPLLLQSDVRGGNEFKDDHIAQRPQEEKQPAGALGEPGLNTPTYSMRDARLYYAGRVSALTSRAEALA